MMLAMTMKGVLPIIGALGTSGYTAAAAAAAPPAPAPDPQSLVRAGMQKFKQQGDVEGSLKDFNTALTLRPSIYPYLWQRGLSLYYIGTPEALQLGAKQFRDDVAVNPNDTEEAIWAFMCEARLSSPEQARQYFVVVGRDSRPVMRAAYEAFRQGLDPIETIRGAVGNVEQGHSAFYSWLYVGLWYEAHGRESDAQAAILKALDTDYARSSGDYMAAVARVHAKRRIWEI